MAWGSRFDEERFDLPDESAAWLQSFHQLNKHLLEDVSAFSNAGHARHNLPSLSLSIVATPKAPFKRRIAKLYITLALSFFFFFFMSHASSSSRWRTAPVVNHTPALPGCMCLVPAENVFAVQPFDHVMLSTRANNRQSFDLPTTQLACFYAVDERLPIMPCACKTF